MATKIKFLAASGVTSAEAVRDQANVAEVEGLRGEDAFILRISAQEDDGNVLGTTSGGKEVKYNVSADGHYEYYYTTNGSIDSGKNVSLGFPELGQTLLDIEDVGAMIDNTIIYFDA